ncbi:uncharacterized protein LOC118415673 isoform X2 [Branchiostoma floridae]|uniref:Uncharacterized protein LOC118415673 isoform X2 n=1 Tax=Branchiostoma floridae TaxID=7739 RepID=A0A9J7L549_BRAFL|nr:uncharacterized protein LOC118415673 isoform X2 [Branchiostoma floridae]
MTDTCADTESSTRAQSDIVFEIMDTCGICREKLCIYKTLSCQHRFCVTCLEKCVRKGKDNFACPLCFQTTTLPDGGVEGLPSYFFIHLERESCRKDQKNRFSSSKLRWDESYFSCDHLSGNDVRGSRTEDNSAVERRRSELHQMLTDLSGSHGSRRERGLLCAPCQKLVDGFNMGKQAIVGSVKEQAVKVRKTIQSTKDSKMPEDIKIILLGDSGSGKTYLLNKYADRSDDDPGPTLGIDFKTKDLTVDDKEVKLQFWDTSGDARFRSMISRYFSQADAVVLVYDTSHPESVNSLKAWREIFFKHQSQALAVFIHIKNAQSKEDLSFLSKTITRLKMGAHESSRTVRLFVDKIVGAAERAGQRVKIFVKKGVTRRDEGDGDEKASDGDVENRADVTFMVIGNRRSTDDSEVQGSDVGAWCRDNNIRYHMISSQHATELDMAFRGLVRDVLAK